MAKRITTSDAVKCKTTSKVILIKPIYEDEEIMTFRSSIHSFCIEDKIVLFVFAGILLF